MEGDENLSVEIEHIHNDCMHQLVALEKEQNRLLASLAEELDAARLSALSQRMYGSPRE